MLERIVATLTDRGCLLDPGAASHIARQPDPEAYLNHVVGRLHELPFILTMEQLHAVEAVMPPAPRPSPLHELLTEMPKPLVAPPPELPGLAPHPLNAARPLAADHPAEVRVLRDSSSNHSTSGDARDFVRYFNDRLDSLTRLLKQRREVANAVRIKDVHRAGRDVQLIGMVKEKSRTPNNYRFLTLEDTTGDAEILIPLDKTELHGPFDSLLNDEVIGIVGRPSKDGALVIADQIVRPDIPFHGDDRRLPEGNLYVGFLGDVHVGSKTFLAKSFRQFVRWTKGDQGPERSQRIARSMKYLVFPGDLVDGVGVYPGQQDGLEIEDVFEQYRQVTRELEDLPEHIHCVILPGNHDASRPTEPQPAMGKDIRSLFDRHPTTFVSNPSMFSLHGVSMLAYHGYSMIDFATTVPGMRMDQPIPIMKQMLQSRHIAPTYGGKTPVLPEDRDSLVINQVPDVFVTGHVHVAAMDRYKGVSLVNGGTWQDQTDYQKMQNLVPTPSRLPVLNLSTLQGTMIDFGVE